MKNPLLSPKAKLFIPPLITLLVIQFLNPVLSNGMSTWGGFHLPDDVTIQDYVLVAGDKIIDGRVFAASGATLKFVVRKEEITVPWTMRIPVFQHGTLSANASFDVFIDDRPLGIYNVSVVERVTAFKPFPVANHARELRTKLRRGYDKTAALRIEEARTRAKRLAATSDLRPAPESNGRP